LIALDSNLSKIFLSSENDSKTFLAIVASCVLKKKINLFLESIFRNIIFHRFNLLHEVRGRFLTSKLVLIRYKPWELIKTTLETPGVEQNQFNLFPMMGINQIIFYCLISCSWVFAID